MENIIIKKIDLLIKLRTIHKINKENSILYQEKIDKNLRFIRKLYKTREKYANDVEYYNHRKKEFLKSKYIANKFKYFGREAHYKIYTQLILLFAFVYLVHFLLGKSLLMFLSMGTNDIDSINRNMSSYLFITLSLSIVIAIFFYPKIRDVISNNRKRTEFNEKTKNSINKVDAIIDEKEKYLQNINPKIEDAENKVKVINQEIVNIIDENVNPNIDYAEQLIKSNPLNLVEKRIFDIEYLSELREIIKTEQATTIPKATVILENRLQNQESIAAMSRNISQRIDSAANMINSSLMNIANDLKKQNEMQIELMQDIDLNVKNNAVYLAKNNEYLNHIQENQNKLYLAEEKNAKEMNNIYREIENMNNARYR